MVDFPHIADRPSWNCRACGEPWPCEPSRTYLASTLGPTPLAVTMWMNLEEAVGHLPPMTPTVAFDRFLRWTRPATQDE